ncbi:MAG: fasciclin domain-containing protein [Prevotella sp.]|nr:fasciclin domain-containing protein [Prevotella sp.]
MMNMKKIKTWMLLIAVALVTNMAVSCNEEDLPDNYYTATEMTAAGFLQNDPARFSEFTRILQRANFLSTLATYGEYTLYAPTNEAVNNYLSANNYGSVEDIPQNVCDTIARTHIVKGGVYFTADVSDGTLPLLNMDDRNITITCDSDVNNNNAIIYYVNKSAKMIERDDSVTNGVVHTIDHLLVSTSMLLPDLIKQDTTSTIFASALALTGVELNMRKVEDYSYTIGRDSVEEGLPEVFFGAEGEKWTKVKFVERRYFKYTAFVETDETFEKAGIYNINDLIAKAKAWYDNVFPEDAGKYDDDYTHPKNPLNRFVSYHILPFLVNYDQLVVSGQIKDYYCDLSKADAEDYYETMAQGCILRASGPKDGKVYLNRKRMDVLITPGVRVLSPTESGLNLQDCANGVYHYISAPLYFNPEALNNRMRIDATTLFPDFLNMSKCRVQFNEKTMTMFKNNYLTNVKATSQSLIGVRGNEIWTNSWEGNMVAICGEFDIEIKLPPVPKTGMYELRLGYSVNPSRGIIQVYLNGIACGVPVNLQQGPEGWKEDTEDEEENRATDKSMHNRGFMKAPDSQGGDISNGGTPFRAAGHIMRRVLYTGEIRQDQENWLRFRQLLKGNYSLSLDYIELCPKNIYASPEGEDTH